MEDKRYNEIVLASEDFGDQLWQIVGEALKILCDAKYECEVYDDDVGIICIKYNYHPSMGFGNHTLEWVSPEEQALLNTYREGKEDFKW